MNLKALIEEHGHPVLLFEPDEVANDDFHDKPEQMAIFDMGADKDSLGRYMCYARYGDRWVANSGERFAIRQLINARPTVESYIEAKENRHRQFADQREHEVNEILKKLENYGEGHIRAALLAATYIGESIAVSALLKIPTK